jgi:hypothetical protein
MNIENISALAEQLQALGFEDAGYSLLKRICFKPEKFILSQKLEKGNEQISFQLFFERTEKQGVYTLVYYDAILQKEISFADTTLNGVDITALEKQMITIDWKKAFDFAETKGWTPTDKTSWASEQKIETIITSLVEIETTEEGKSIAAILKLKYWTGSAYFEIFDNISQTKNKAEISQRFYCSEGQPGISVDEAYRFLQNRKLEKQMQAKRKQTDNQNDEVQDEENSSSSGSGLPKKRRLNGGAKTKKHKAPTS